MSDVYDEFQETLRTWARECAGRPRDEMLRLFLIALEREELVSVGYRETLIASRLRSLSIPDDVRELMRHALLWAWKDEEMHALYIRGVLMRLGSAAVRARAAGAQMGGAVGGWAASVRQHVPWRRAPIANLAALAVTTLGAVAGKVPAAVRAQLEYGRFSAFCRFNVDAERTASLCWDRLAQLAREDPAQPASVREEFQRMKDDEDRHARVFEAIADALDDEDGLRPGETAETLAARLAAIGPFFLPPDRRPGAAGEPRPACGGVVHVLRGVTRDEKQEVFARLLQAVDLDAILADRAASRGRPVSALRVALKPNFMIGYDRKDLSCVTDPALVEALAAALRARGVAELSLIDAPTVYDRFYGNRDVRSVAAYLGFVSPHYAVVDAGEDQVPHAYLRGMAQHSVSRHWRDADVRISFAKMRANPVDMATLTVANLEGLGPRHDEFFFVERQAQRDTTMTMLLGEFPPHLALLDAYDSASDGILGMMGNPRPPAPLRLYAARDAVALDIVALRHMGLDDPDRCNTLQEARHWFGDARPRTTVAGVDTPLVGWRGPLSSDWFALLSLLSYPVYQFGSGRGALFVPEMDEAAFPPLRPPGLALRLGRRAVQAAFGLRHPR